MKRGKQEGEGQSTVKDLEAKYTIVIFHIISWIIMENATDAVQEVAPDRFIPATGFHKYTV